MTVVAHAELMSVGTDEIIVTCTTEPGVSVTTRAGAHEVRLKGRTTMPGSPGSSPIPSTTWWSRGQRRDAWLPARVRTLARPLQARAARGGEAQGPEGLESPRTLGASPRHSRQGHGQAALRHRRAAAGHGLRRDRAVPGVPRQAEGRSRRAHPRPARPRQGGEARRRGRGGRRQLVAREQDAQAAADRVGRGSERRGDDGEHPRVRALRPGGFRDPGGAQRRRRRGARSPPPPRWSRPSTSRLSSTTRPSSR